MIEIRGESEADWGAVHSLLAAAFEHHGEADLVDTLRQRAAPMVSLVADDAGQVVGHILFTPVTLPSHADLKLMGLAPMAVVPGRQNQGIGGALVHAGLDHCRALGVGAVVVLGHAEYYPRFGFVPAVRFGLGCEFEVPEEVFMVQELVPGYLKDASGDIHYHAAFREMADS